VTGSLDTVMNILVPKMWGTSLLDKKYLILKNDFVRRS